MSRISRTLAVAVAYEEPNVPRVVGVGRGLVGDRIIAVARENGVPLEKNPVLAQALSTIALEEEIPEQLYLAIAQILAFILRASGKLPADPEPEKPPRAPHAPAFPLSYSLPG